MLLTQLDKYKDPETSSYDQTSFTEIQGKKGRKIVVKGVAFLE